MEQAGASRRREPAVRRGGDAALDGARARRAAPPRSWAARYLRMRGHEGGCLAILGFEGDEDEVEDRAPPRAARSCAAGGGVALGRRPGRRLAAQAATHGAVPARRAAGPRRARRDARDRDDLVATSARSTARSADALRTRARRPRHAAARDVPRLAPVSVRRVALLHVPGAPGGGRARAVAGGQDGGVRGDRRGRRHDHPPPRRRPRPRAVDAGRGRRARPRAAAGRQGAARPRGDHEPRASCCPRPVSAAGGRSGRAPRAGCPGARALRSFGTGPRSTESPECFTSAASATRWRLMSMKR